MMMNNNQDNDNDNNNIRDEDLYRYANIIREGCGNNNSNNNNNKNNNNRGGGFDGRDHHLHHLPTTPTFPSSDEKRIIMGLSSHNKKKQKKELQLPLFSYYEEDDESSIGGIEKDDSYWLIENQFMELTTTNKNNSEFDADANADADADAAHHDAHDVVSSIFRRRPRSTSTTTKTTATTNTNTKTTTTKTTTRDHLDAVEAMLDSTIEDVLRDPSPTQQHVIERNTSLIMEDEDDDLSEELDQLETSKQLFWEDLNNISLEAERIDDLSLSIIASSSPSSSSSSTDDDTSDPILFSEETDNDDSDDDDDEMADDNNEDDDDELKKCLIQNDGSCNNIENDLKQKDTNGSTVVSELSSGRLMDLVIGESSSSTSVQELLTARTSNMQKKGNRDHYYFKTDTTSSDTMIRQKEEEEVSAGNMVDAASDSTNNQQHLNTYFSTNTFQDHHQQQQQQRRPQKGAVPTSIKRNKGPLLQAENNGIADSETKHSVDVRSTNTNDETQDASRESSGHKTKDRNVRRGRRGRSWLKLPKRLSFGRKKRKKFRQDGSIGCGKGTTNQRMESIQEELTQRGDVHDLKEIVVDHVDHVKQQRQVDNKSSVLEREPTINVTGDEENDPPHGKGEQRDVIKKLLKIIKKRKSKNRKLRRQKKKLCNMLADAWNDKRQTQADHHKQTMCFADILQQKLQEASHRIRECEKENRKLKAELESFKEKEQQQLEQEQHRRRLFCSSIEPPNVVDHKILLEWYKTTIDWQRKFEIETKARYEVNSVVHDTKLKHAIQELQESCERQSRVLQEMNQIVGSSVGSQQQQRQQQETLPAIRSSTLQTITPLSIRNTTEMRNTVNEGKDDPSTSLFEQIRQHLPQSEMQSIKDPHAVKPVEQPETQGEVEDQRNNKIRGPLKPFCLLKDNARRNLQPPSRTTSNTPPVPSMKENWTPNRQYLPSIKNENAAPPSLHRRASSCPATLDPQQNESAAAAAEEEEVRRPATTTIAMKPSSQQMSEETTLLMVEMTRNYVQFQILLLCFLSWIMHSCCESS